jgi:hypothetical protein
MMIDYGDLLESRQGVIRVPFLIKGKIVAPPEISKDKIEAAFANVEKDTPWTRIPEAQLLREPIIDRRTLRCTGEYAYQILPPVKGGDLVERDIDKLVRGLYNLSVIEILDYLSAIGSVLAENFEVAKRVMEMTRLTTEFPDAFVDHWFASAPSLINRDAAQGMIDHELSWWGHPGSEFLDGWVEVPSEIEPGVVSTYSRQIFGGDKSSSSNPKSFIRAVPTRQLHITAGNTPEVPWISTLRAILSKSAAVIKLPFGATLTGSMMALIAAALPDHPLTQNLSLVYWPGGDEGMENVLFAPGSFDRIVVWGSPEAVSSVQARALYTRTVFFNPRFGVSLIGREAFHGDLEKAAILGSMDSMVYNQKACTSSQVHYIEGTREQAEQYAELLRQAMQRWDREMPQFISPSARGQIKRLRRGKYSNEQWKINSREDEFCSGVVVMPGEFDILDHPMCRLIVVRPVADLSESLKYLHAGVSTVGVYPEERRLALRDSISARGVSNILPLGECERTFAGMPQDGMPVLSQLVDWKNS